MKQFFNAVVACFTPTVDKLVYSIETKIDKLDALAERNQEKCSGLECQIKVLKAKVAAIDSETYRAQRVAHKFRELID